MGQAVSPAPGLLDRSAGMSRLSELVSKTLFHGFEFPWDFNSYANETVKEKDNAQYKRTIGSRCGEHGSYQSPFSLLLAVRMAGSIANFDFEVLGVTY